MWIWVGAVILSGVGFMVGVEMLLKRLGIQPVDPASRAGGVRDVARKVHGWSASRNAAYERRRTNGRDKT